MLIYGKHDQNTLNQLQSCVDAGAEKAILCADGHLGYSVPIGGVLAHQNGVFVQGVGYDIGCGNLAIKTDADIASVKKNISSIMDKIFSQIEFGIGKSNHYRTDHALFDSPTWRIAPLAQNKQLAREQLGTVGSGNHYVDIFEGDDGFVWVGVHFGSRGLGHKTATYFMKNLGAKDDMMSPPVFIDALSGIGADYLECMSLAGEYAKAGREWVANHVVKNILKATALDEVHNHHNYAWREVHNGINYWVVRKGATPAFPGQRGFIGGSMGDNAVIVHGVESEKSSDSLYSTVHGAGRVMSRNNAKKTIDPLSMQKWLAEKNVCLRGADLDEAPQAYRRLSDVLKYHDGTIQIETVLKPLGVAMAAKFVKDPYKD